MKKIHHTRNTLACLLLGLGLSACGNTGADYQPILDGTPNAHYSADLASCQQVSTQRSYLNDNAKSEGALAAGIGGVIGGLEDGVEGAIAGALVGGALGTGAKAWETLEDRQQIVVACMQQRGHPVVG